MDCEHILVELTLPVAERGQLCVNGPNLMSGYLDAPATNPKLMMAHGFETGDIGCQDEDGFLFFDGWRADITNVDGETVSIRMIEEAATGFKDLSKPTVIPVYDKHLGMEPTLFYMAKTEPKLNRKSLRKMIKSRLPANHVPTKFEEVDAIKRSAPGKFGSAADLNRLGAQR